MIDAVMVWYGTLRVFETEVIFIYYLSLEVYNERVALSMKNGEWLTVGWRRETESKGPQWAHGSGVDDETRKSIGRLWQSLQ